MTMTEKWKGRSGKQTADDIARLFSEEFSDEDASRIEHSHRDDPGARQDFLDMLQMVGDIDALAGIADYKAQYREIADAPTGRSATYHWPKLAFAAVILLATAVSLTMFWQVDVGSSAKPDIQRYVTRVGEQKTLALIDGSTITLNTGSEVLVDINQSYRRVTLSRGEVYFEVAKDPGRPFTVSVDSRSVTVMGTAFNIFKTPEDFTLSVLEGVVSVHKAEERAMSSSPKLLPSTGAANGGEIAIDNPGQRLVMAGTVVKYPNWQDRVLVSAVKQPRHVASWRNGLLRYNGQPLSTVIQEFNRYSAKKILIEDAAVMDLKIVATFKLDRINIALSDLEKILPIKVIRHFDRIVIVEKKSE